MIRINRDTPNSTSILLGGPNTTRIRLYISYSTVVAVRVFHEDARDTFQCIESPSRATTKHMRIWGAENWAVVSEATLQATIRQAMMEIGLGLIGPQWAESAKKAA